MEEIQLEYLKKLSALSLIAGQAAESYGAGMDDLRECVNELEEQIASTIAAVQQSGATGGSVPELVGCLTAQKDKVIAVLLSGSRVSHATAAVRDVNITHARYVDERARVHAGMRLLEDAAVENLIGPALVEFGGKLVDYADDVDRATGSVERREHVTHKQNAKKKSEILPQAPYPFDFDIPTGRQTRSPVFGADKFDQSLLLCEELGPAKLSNCVGVKHGVDQTEELLASGWWPAPMDRLDPSGATFLANANEYPGLHPDKYAAVSTPNMWKDSVGAFLAETDFRGPIEGRGAGHYGAHAKWEEGDIESMFVTSVADAMTNTGFRDALQSHSYSEGEFGPGGLYHCTLQWQRGSGEKTEKDVKIEGTTRGVEARFHPKMPSQQQTNALWTYDGTFPPKVHCARYGGAHVMRIYNLLPINPSHNLGFGLHTTTTHEHNGHNGSTVDGFLNNFYFPGQYYDYSWRMTLDGHDTVKNDPDSQGITDEGDAVHIPGDSREIMSTHWFHDHMADYTSQNVYKGIAAVMNYYSAKDNGNELANNAHSLRLPSGCAKSWGNRDYDVNLILADKAWSDDGLLWYNPYQSDGFLGDHLLTNWQYYPYFNVRARRYRFRLLNASVSRMIKVALVVRRDGDSAGGGEFRSSDDTCSYDRVPFWLVANDGNLLEHTVCFDGTRGTERGVLPVMSVAERYDIVIDFSSFSPGTRLYLVNVSEHKTGKRQEGNDGSLAEILCGDYGKRSSPANGILRGDPCVGKFLELRVFALDESINGGVDHSTDPKRYEIGGHTMIPINRSTEQEIRAATHRHFTFVKTAADKFKWAIVTDHLGGADLMKQSRVTAAPKRESVEVWHFQNNGDEWVHGVHVHFAEGNILLRDGGLPPIWEQLARKDVYRIGGTHRDGSANLVFVIRFRDYTGHYMAHCHLTSHEDNSMLFRFDIEDTAVEEIMSCPYPTWFGVDFVRSFGKPTFRRGISGSRREVTVDDVIEQLRAAAHQDNAFLVHSIDALRS